MTPVDRVSLAIVELRAALIPLFNDLDTAMKRVDDLARAVDELKNAATGGHE